MQRIVTPVQVESRLWIFQNYEPCWSMTLRLSSFRLNSRRSELQTDHEQLPGQCEPACEQGGRCELARAAWTRSALTVPKPGRAATRLGLGVVSESVHRWLSRHTPSHGQGRPKQSRSGRGTEERIPTRMIIFALEKFYVENYDVLWRNDCFKRKKTLQNSEQVSPRVCKSNFRPNLEIRPHHFTPC